ncbi:hypothetical protein [Hasllibacter sp. MH4015]|uniref:hypothetical protein n=1 Tax=Hasllibacter sp. MH4015 TaxID=2854029 RepID=UPI001CD2D27D|nr:hypothetical protein [Hasllibacter sp. MH4015]
MFKHATFAAIGLTAAISAAQADTHDHLYPSPHDTPAFERLVEMCAHFGITCDLPDVAAEDDLLHPFDLSSPEALADLEKRLALMEQDWEEYAEVYGIAPDLPPVWAPVRPHNYPVPRHLFGWGPSDVTPHVVPHPDAWPRAHVWPRPRVEILPRLDPAPGWPRHGYLDLTNPFRALDNAPNLPRHLFPRGTLRHGHVFPWPSL